MKRLNDWAGFMFRINLEKPSGYPDIKTSIQIVRSKLASTYDDKKKRLFQGMKDMLEYMDEKTSDKQFYFGTDDFDHVWEKLIDRAFGERDKEKLFSTFQMAA